MKTRAKVVVIGGVDVGVSTQCHLASKGWGDDVLLIDRGAGREPVQAVGRVELVGLPQGRDAYPYAALCSIDGSQTLPHCLLQSPDER